ncbi:MAG: hypothetical protein OEW68_07600 [Gammaproteobacteria bacterium]|nr:hypothetical protein [Gammaproteobacteria bacterium]MDH4314689.1 hypothetical protein [Gammaproteobacteria bacterium]MDH5214971.1 hypothetical protein [Gammaproteobacteria bacterium]MDH5501381.1 hypothetical protein [Gammaproteobacteria bacterium]
MNKFKVLACAGLMSVLAACGGGSDAPATPPVVVTPPPVDQLPGGLWFGTMTFDAAMGSEDVIGMVSEDGRLRLISADTLTQMSALVTVAGTSLTGDGKAFASPGGIWPDGSTVGDLSIAATVAQRNTMSGAWSTTATESGTFDLYYDDFYERDSSLSLLSGMWTAYDDLGNPDVTFTIQNSGSFDGQNMQGCVSNGQISIIDSRFDLYAVQSTISGCGIAGDYSGLISIFDLISQNDAMVFVVDNGSTAILLGLQK